MKKRGRKPEIKADDLIKAGYTYKMDILTADERDEWVNGQKGVDSKGREVRYETRDFDYFFKPLPNGGEIKIFHAIRKFYYNNVRIKYAEQLPNFEKHASEQKQWDDLQQNVVDTAVVDYVIPDTIKPGQTIITLKGGPLDGTTRAWMTTFKYFLEQYDFRVMHGKRIGISARYMQDKTEKTLYHFERIF